MLRRLSVRTDRGENSPFARDITRMSLYLAAGQGVYLAITPLITRLYTPADLGAYGLLLSIAIASAVAICLNYDLAIPAIHDDDEAAAAAVGGALISLVLSLAGGLFITAACYFNWFGLGVLSVWAGPLFFGIMQAQALLQLITAWLTRRQRIRVIGETTFNLNLSRAAALLGFGAAGFGWIGLILGEIVGRVASCGQVIWQLGPRSLLVKARRIPAARIRSALVTHRHFATIQLPGLMIDAVTPMIIVAGVTFLYGLEAAGQYFLMRRIVDIPIGFIYRAISDAYYGRIAAEARKDPTRIRHFLIRVTIPIAIVALGMMVLLIVTGPLLFPLLLGPQWHVAGVLAAVIAPAAAANLTVAPIARTLSLSRLAHLRYIFTGLNTGGGVLVLLLAYLLTLHMIAMVSCLSAVIFAAYCALFICVYVGAGHLARPASGGNPAVGSPGMADEVADIID